MLTIINYTECRIHFVFGKVIYDLFLWGNVFGFFRTIYTLLAFLIANIWMYVEICKIEKAAMMKSYALRDEIVIYVSLVHAVKFKHPAKSLRIWRTFGFSSIKLPSKITVAGFMEE